MIVAGIDPSLTSAGIAIVQDGQPVHIASPGFTDRGGGYSGKSWKLRNRRVRYQNRQIYEAIMTVGKPDLMLIEEHPYGAKAFGGEFDRAFLWHKIIETFDLAKIPFVVVHNQTLKVWVTGKGSCRDTELTRTQRRKQDKQLMIDTVSSWWPDWKGRIGKNDDVADALGLAAIGAFHLGDPMPFPVKPRHTTGLDKVDWPASVSCAKPEPVQVTP